MKHLGRRSRGRCTSFQPSVKGKLHIAHFLLLARIKLQSLFFLELLLHAGRTIFSTLLRFIRGRLFTFIRSVISTLLTGILGCRSRTGLRWMSDDGIERRAQLIGESSEIPFDSALSFF